VKDPGDVLGYEPLDRPDFPLAGASLKKLEVDHRRDAPQLERIPDYKLARPVIPA
jgi:hypothetical protein